MSLPTFARLTGCRGTCVRFPLSHRALLCHGGGGNGSEVVDVSDAGGCGHIDVRVAAQVAGRRPEESAGGRGGAP